jgi:hypothetical protein
MKRPIIPPDPQGYMLTGVTLHNRYATHVERGQRVRTIDGVWALVSHMDYQVCTTCYTPPPKTRRKPATRKKTADA